MNNLFFKKSFFDCWDNLFPLLTTNVVFAFLLFGLKTINSAWLCIIVLLVICFHLAGTNAMACRWVKTDAGSNGNFKNYFYGIFEHVGHTFVLFVILTVVFFYITFLLPFALNTGNAVLQASTYLSIGLLFIVCCASSFLLPLSLFMPNDSPFKSLKKCFLILFDNRRFALTVIFTMVGNFALSYFAKMILPGLTYICVSQLNAVFIVLKKYDWMEEKGITQEPKDPQEYLQKEIDLISERSFSEIIHPFRHK